jgi:hypothetical protein
MNVDESIAARLAAIRESIADPIEFAAAHPGVLQNSRILTEIPSMDEIDKRAPMATSDFSSNFSSSFQGQFASQAPAESE